MRNEARDVQSSVARLATGGGNAEQIADAAVATWCDVDAALSPVIGHRGVAALYKRSLHLTRAAHACLAPVHEGELQPGEFGALHATLSQQTSQDAAAAHGALLQAFCDLLTHLIGASLTEQLLRAVLDKLSGGNAAQDTTQ
jgi:hypothetical protein